MKFHRYLTGTLLLLMTLKNIFPLVVPFFVFFLGVENSASVILKSFSVNGVSVGIGTILNLLKDYPLIVVLLSTIVIFVLAYTWGYMSYIRFIKKIKNVENTEYEAKVTTCYQIISYYYKICFVPTIIVLFPKITLMIIMTVLYGILLLLLTYIYHFSFFNMLDDVP